MKTNRITTLALAIPAIIFTCLSASTGEETKSSSWKGTWQADDNPAEHCGELECTAAPVVGKRWEAEFKGYCNRQFVYQVQMKGKQKGDKIVFKGEADLGEKDGAYTWTGKIVGDTFTGSYTSAKGKTGSFTMNRAETH